MSIPSDEPDLALLAAAPRDDLPRTTGLILPRLIGADQMHRWRAS
ncbi:MAG TPA: hypothetical protein VKI44_21650 [Acetobacteraceae bacterium]|nr:hypothetical protein [Acetobacteraceae bacterium]